MRKNLVKFAVAAIIYACFALYLHSPYFKHFNVLQYLLVINVCLASLGCFVFSRRWVGTFAGSLFAGCIYGFGPFALALAGFHPAAGLMAAAIPWLFCPAAFAPKLVWRWLSWPLSALPFAAILLFFQLLTYYRLFVIPTNARLRLADLAGLLVPLVIAERGLTSVGFYHVPIASLIMGFCMLFAARRFNIMIIFTAGAVLAFCNSVFAVSPIIWLTIPVLCCSILIGEGLQGLILAGYSDRKWVLLTAVFMTVLSVIPLLLATKYANTFAGLGLKYANLLTEAAGMYILAAIVVTIIFLMARAKLRLVWLRLTLLCSAMALDIFLGARFIVDKIF